jgi:hypothetical protein
LDLVKKILSISFSFGMVIFKTADLTEFTGEPMVDRFTGDANSTLADVIGYLKE